MRTRLLRWVLVVTLGEAVGFTVPAAVGIAVTSASWGPVVTLVAMVLGGSVEGAILGTAQADCLYRWAYCQCGAGGSWPQVSAQPSHGRLGCCRARLAV